MAVQNKYYRFHLNIFAPILIIFFSFTYKSLHGQNINPSVKSKSDFISQEEKEFNKIKQLKVKSRSKYSVYYDLKGYMNDKKELITKESFNKKGSLTNIAEYNYLGKVVSTYKFKYDSKGKPIKAEGMDDSGKLNTQVSKYDSRGNEIERTLTSIGRKKFETKSLFKYDKENNLIEIKNYTGDKFSDQQNIIYKNGIRVRTVILNEKGDTALVSIPEYNSSGKLTSEKNKNQSFVYKYDQDWNLNEMVDAETKRTYIYDQMGNLVDYKMYLLDGRRQLKLIFKYNEKGLQSDQVRYDNNEDIVLHYTYEYEYYK